MHGDQLVGVFEPGPLIAKGNCGLSPIAPLILLRFVKFLSNSYPPDIFRNFSVVDTVCIYSVMEQELVALSF